MHCIRKLEKITKDPWVLATVNGYGLPLNSQPYQEHVPQQYHLSPAEQAGLEEQLQKMMSLRAIERAPQESGRQFVSQHFVIPKSDGRWRAVFNLKNLNNFIQTEHFKMDSLNHVSDLLALPRLGYVQTRSKGCVPYD